jgi:hypothetical protein
MAEYTVTPKATAAGKATSMEAKPPQKSPGILSLADRVDKVVMGFLY